MLNQTDIDSLDEILGLLGIADHEGKPTNQRKPVPFEESFDRDLVGEHRLANNRHRTPFIRVNVWPRTFVATPSCVATADEARVGGLAQS